MISVIVPVYNAERYLHRCIDSLLAQTYIDFELLLVDDGSPDGSATICDEYAAKDSRVRVFHKKNGGVASARQCGIDNAKGEYTIHVDPDDWVESTMLEELHNKAVEEDAEMVICNYWLECKESSSLQVQKPSKNDSESVLKDILFHRLHGSLCNKLIKRTCYTDYQISFVNGLNYCEDYIVCVKILMKNFRVTYFDKAFYHYDQVVNNDSITRKYTLDSYYQRCFFIDELKKVLGGMYDKAILKNEASIAMECIRHRGLPKKEFKRIYSKRKWTLFKYINGYRSKLKFLLEILL